MFARPWRSCYRLSTGERPSEGVGPGMLGSVVGGGTGRVGDGRVGVGLGGSVGSGTTGLLHAEMAARATTEHAQMAMRFTSSSVQRSVGTEHQHG